MHNLIEFFAHYKHWFLFLLLEVVAMVLLFQFNNYQGSVWFTSANAVSGRLLAAESEVVSYFQLKGANEALTRRNIELEQRVSYLSSQLADKKAAADTTQQRNPQQKIIEQYKLVDAKVVSNTIDRADNFITIDRGSADGVEKDMGVACGTGVVGIVYLVSSHYSIVIPVLNTKSNISCAIENRGYFGYLHWNGGASDVAYVDNIPRHARFNRGDNVVTSGYSSVFPPGLRVGRIGTVYNSRDGLSYRLKLKLSTDFSRLRDVCVLDNRAVRERLELLQAAQDSLRGSNM